MPTTHNVPFPAPLSGAGNESYLLYFDENPRDPDFCQSTETLLCTCTRKEHFYDQ